MLRRRLETVTGHTDEAHQTRIARLDRRAQRTVGGERHVPLGLVHEVVQLDEIDVIRAQPLERAADLVASLGVRSPAGLCRDEETITPGSSDPGRDAQLGVAVAGRRVDVVDAVTLEQVEHPVRDRLRHA